MRSIICLKNDHLNTGLGERKLALSPVQTDFFFHNSRSKETEYVNSLNSIVANNAEVSSEVVPNNPLPPVSPVGNPQPPVTPGPPVVNNAQPNNKPAGPVFNFSDEPANMNIALNETPANPIQNPNIEPQVIPIPNAGPQIITNNQKTDFDVMQEEISKATEEYQNKITSIIEAYKAKINETLKQAEQYKEQASEHLKNAQAAEQIAHMAYENSQNSNVA